MKKLYHLLFLSMCFISVDAVSQTSIDDKKFFEDERPLEMTLSSDFKTLMAKRTEHNYQPAEIEIRFPDSSSIKEEIRINTRGKFRLQNCYMPPLLLNFKNPTSPKLTGLGKLKLVVGCGTNTDEEQLIIKEYMAYKMYNVLTDKSFRVRLLKIKFTDSRNKIKSYTQYGFLLEDVDDMAQRNNCTEVEGVKYNSEATDRYQMTLVAIFQYMIGNTDWSVPAYHNIKLMRPAKDSISFPYAVPYDLNHCGLVNAHYAAPPEQLGITSVTERVYRGFPRSMEELEDVLTVFKKQKEPILAMVKNNPWLSSRNKREMTDYLNDFYSSIEKKSSIKNIFIDNARKD